VSETGARFVGHRRVDRYCAGGEGEDEVLDATLLALDGVGAVLTAKIGRCPRQRLAEAGIVVVDDFAFDYVETAIARWLFRPRRDGRHGAYRLTPDRSRETHPDDEEIDRWPT
jgi:hypothetical protein